MQPYSDTKKYIIISVLLLVLFGGFVGGYFFARAGYTVELNPVRFVNTNRENAPKDVNWQILWDAIDVINQKYVEGKPDQQQLLYGAVSGLVGALGDPYSVFLTPKNSEQFQEDLRGEFDGIGAEIGVRNNQLMIISPLEGSPAEKAKLKPYDVILEIEGESTQGLGLEEAVNKIRGKKGTEVTLKILSRDANEPRDVTITRDKIVVKSVTSDVKELDGKKIGVIELRRFGEETKGELDSAITDLLSKGVKGIVLDLRNNPGGYITSAIDVASNWVEEGKAVVSEQYGDGAEVPHDAVGVSRLAGLPTVVLVNEGSASASEIVAGALRDYDLATLVGKKTFGKGSVQELVDLPQGADIKITIAKWLTPDGYNINIQGLEPDVEVDLTAEDIDNFRDPQMDKALEELQAKL